MKLAVFSDVHSNLTALRAVLEDVAKKKVDYYLCAGDLVGYGPWPNEVCDVVRSSLTEAAGGNFIIVKGNHDRAVVRGDFAGLKPLAADAAVWTWRRLSAPNRLFLKRLDPLHTLKLGGFRIFLVHGSPRDYLNDYIHPNDNDDDDDGESGLNGLFRITDNADILIMGHTHIPFIRQLDGKKLVVNPGSVGQPRDRDPRASWVLLDLDTSEVTFRRLEYDINEVVGEMKKVGLPGALGEGLYYGL